MSHVNDNTRSFPVSSATISRNLRVKISGGSLAAAGATDLDVGTVENAVLSTDSTASVRLSSGCGTQKCVAAGAITAGAKVYTAASGKVSATQATGAFLRGIALAAAAADGDYIEIMPVLGDTAGS